MKFPQRVFIAEDESKVCKLLLKLIDWERVGLETAGTAADGLEALEAIRRLKPDIVITDIRMPGIDGLELINRHRAGGGTALFVIISGYRDFDYAREAIKSGVEDYILKPVQKDELNRTLEKIRDKILEHDSSPSLRGQLAERYNILHRQLAVRIAESRGAMSRTAFDQLCAEYRLSLGGDFFQSFFLVFQPTADDFPNETALTVLEKLIDLPVRLLSPVCRALSCIQDREGLSLFVAYDGSETESLGALLREICEQSSILMEPIGGCQVTIGAGLVGSDGFSWVQSLEQAVHAARNRVSLRKSGILAYGSGVAAVRTSSLTLNAGQERTLSGFFEILDSRAVAKWFEDQRSNLTEGLPSCQLFAFAEQIMQLFKRSIPPDQTPADVDSVAAMYRNFRNVKNVEDLFRAVSQPIVDAMEYCADARRQRESLPVRIAREYIDGHYAEQLRLDDLAELTHLNPTYLGTLFKKEAGILFSDYLIQRRIEAAKDLLRTGDRKLAAISAEVGYPEVKYFFKVFRKIVGITPAEYRRIYR